MLSLGALDKVLAVLEDAELLCVEIASHLAQRCTLLQPDPKLCSFKHFKHFAVLPAQILDFTAISLSGQVPGFLSKFDAAVQKSHSFLFHQKVRS